MTDPQKQKFGTTFRTNADFGSWGDQASYQTSGIPWITSSQVDPSGSWEKVTFPYVSQRIHVENIDRYYSTLGQESGSAPIAIFFGDEDPSNGVSGQNPRQLQKNNAYFLEDTNEKETFRVRSNHIYVANMSGFGSSAPQTASYNIMVEMSSAPKTQQIEFTGSRNQNMTY